VRAGGTAGGRALAGRRPFPELCVWRRRGKERGRANGGKAGAAPAKKSPAAACWRSGSGPRFGSRSCFVFVLFFTCFLAFSAQPIKISVRTSLSVWNGGCRGSSDRLTDMLVQVVHYSKRFRIPKFGHSSDFCLKWTWISWPGSRRVIWRGVQVSPRHLLLCTHKVMTCIVFNLAAIFNLTCHFPYITHRSTYSTSKSNWRDDKMASAKLLSFVTCVLLLSGMFTPHTCWPN
jgi:hypothetical protein